MKYIKHDNPLYCFKIVEEEDTYKLKRIDIEYYAESTRYPRDPAYFFDGKKITGYSVESITKEKMDRLIHKKIYSFNSDQSYIEGIVCRDLIAKRDLAKEKLDRCQDKIDKWLKTHDVGKTECACICGRTVSEIIESTPEPTMREVREGFLCD